MGKFLYILISLTSLLTFSASAQSNRFETAAVSYIVDQISGSNTQKNNVFSNFVSTECRFVEGPEYQVRQFRNNSRDWKNPVFVYWYVYKDFYYIASVSFSNLDVFRLNLLYPPEYIYYLRKLIL